MIATSRWLKSMLPVTLSVAARLPISAGTMRIPRFCMGAGSIVTPGALPAAVSPSAYLGWVFIPIEDSAPGLS